jgi:hypothetical protein
MCMCMHMHVHVAEREWYVTKEGEHNEKREGFKKRNEKQEEKEMQKKRSTGPSALPAWPPTAVLPRLGPA